MIRAIPDVALSTDERRVVCLACDEAVAARARAKFSDAAAERLADLSVGEGDTSWADNIDGASYFTIRPLSRRELRCVAYGASGATAAERTDALVVETLRYGLVDGWPLDELDALPAAAAAELWAHVNRLSGLGKAGPPSQS